MDASWGGAGEPAYGGWDPRVWAGFAGVFLLPVADDLRADRDPAESVSSAGQAYTRAGVGLAEFLTELLAIERRHGSRAPSAALVAGARASWIEETLSLLAQGRRPRALAELPGPGTLRRELRDLYRATTRVPGAVPEAHALVRVRVRWPRPAQGTPLERATDDAGRAALVVQVLRAALGEVVVARGEDGTLICLLPTGTEPLGLARTIRGVLTRDLPGDWGVRVQAEGLPGSLGEALAALSRESVVGSPPGVVRRRVQPPDRVVVPAQRRAGHES